MLHATAPKPISRLGKYPWRCSLWKTNLKICSMEEDEILKSLQEKAEKGDIEAVKALMEYEKLRKYNELIYGLDEDESTGQTTFPNQIQFN